MAHLSVSPSCTWCQGKNSCLCAHMTITSRNESKLILFSGPHSCHKSCTLFRKTVSSWPNYLLKTSSLQMATLKITFSTQNFKNTLKPYTHYLGLIYLGRSCTHADPRELLDMKIARIDPRPIKSEPPFLTSLPILWFLCFKGFLHVKAKPICSHQGSL